MIDVWKAPPRPRRIARKALPAPQTPTTTPPDEQAAAWAKELRYGDLV